MRAEALQHPRKSPKQAPRATEERSHASPRNTPLLPLVFKCFFTFALFGLRKSRGNTNAPQKIIKFCPFLAYFALIRGYLGAPDSPAAPMGSGATSVPRCCQPIRNGSPQGKRERGKGNATSEKGKKRSRAGDKPTSPQRKGHPPPIAKGRQPFPSSQIRAKKSAKSRLGVVLKKFSEKFFVGMFRGKEKPLALSQRKGF